jgi:hypothetical protein
LTGRLPGRPAVNAKRDGHNRSKQFAALSNFTVSLVRRFMLSNRSPPNGVHWGPWSESSVVRLAVQAGNTTGQARNVNAVACGLSSVGTRRGSRRSWRRLGRGGLGARRVRRGGCAACRRYPSAANGNHQGGSTTEQRDLGPSLTFISLPFLVSGLSPPSAEWASTR